MSSWQQWLPPWWRLLLLPLDCLIATMILPPLLFYVLMLLGKHALLPSKQSGGHPSVNSLEGIPVSSMSWDLLLYPVHKITMSKPCLFYFASFGAKLGASARQVLRIRKYFKDGKDAATIKAQREVKILGGETQQALRTALQSIKLRATSLPSIHTEVEFTTDDSLSAAFSESQHGLRVAILDAANRSLVGGLGMCPYAGTQEEDLIRASNLYFLLSPVINKQLQRQCQRVFESSEQSAFRCHIPYFGCVVAPGVSFLSEHTGDANALFDVIACAFPDFRSRSDEWLLYFCAATRSEIRHVIMRKVEAILCAAVRLRCQSLVLTAIGCGVFAGSNRRLAQLLEPTEPGLHNKLAMSRVVASCFAEALGNDMFRDRFERVVFAIAYDKALYTEFENSFKKSFLGD